jgi:hypothetical protein
MNVSQLNAYLIKIQENLCFSLYINWVLNVHIIGLKVIANDGFYVDISDYESSVLNKDWIKYNGLVHDYMVPFLEPSLK